MLRRNGSHISTNNGLDRKPLVTLFRLQQTALHSLQSARYGCCGATVVGDALDLARHHELPSALRTSPTSARMKSGESFKPGIMRKSSIPNSRACSRCSMSIS
jgi:hypothetical protein